MVSKFFPTEDTMKRYLSLLALLLITLLISTACGDNPPVDVDPTDTTEAVPQTEPAPVDLDIIQNGTVNYAIVRGEKADDTTVAAATQLFKTIIEKTGIYPEFTTDWIKPGSSYDSSTLEILVGATGHSESAEALKDIPYGDYVITPVGNKLVINAWSSSALSSAVYAFMDEMANSTTEGNFSLPADYCKTGTAIKSVNALPAYGDGGPSVIYHTGDDNQLLIFENTTEDAYNAYLKSLENAGFTLYANNKITENAFATYINDDYVVNAGYYDYQKSVRVIIEPRTNLPGLKAREVGAGLNDHAHRFLVVIVTGVHHVVVVDISGEGIFGDLVVGVQGESGIFQGLQISIVGIFCGVLKNQKLIVIAGVVDDRGTAVSVGGEGVDRFNGGSGFAVIGREREIPFGSGVGHFIHKGVHCAAERRTAPGIDDQLIAHRGDDIVAVGNILQRLGGFAVAGGTHQNFQRTGIIAGTGLDPVGSELGVNAGLFDDGLEELGRSRDGCVIGLFPADDGVVDRAVLDDVKVNGGRFGLGYGFGGVGGVHIDGRIVAAGGAYQQGDEEQGQKGKVTFHGVLRWKKF